ncbi:MAG: hypothetical protein U9N86_10705 [Bacteroidota bacterium]|nr:hypothetical protein [Bacteroidota bacterium]
MKFLVCPQCGVNRFYILNPEGNRLLVRVSREYVILPINPDEKFEGYIIEILYCLGCSWSGSKERLVKFIN